eukprot:762028-Hanusia_phi.AAC.3
MQEGQKCYQEKGIHSMFSPQKIHEKNAFKNGVKFRRIKSDRTYMTAARLAIRKENTSETVRHVTYEQQ